MHAKLSGPFLSKPNASIKKFLVFVKALFFLLHLTIWMQVLGRHAGDPQIMGNFDKSLDFLYIAAQKSYMKLDRRSLR